MSAKSWWGKMAGRGPGRKPPPAEKYRKRAEVTGGKDVGRMGYVWFVGDHPEKKVSKAGWTLRKGKYLLVTFDSGWTSPVQAAHVKILHELEQLYKEPLLPDPPPRLEDVPPEGLPVVEAEVEREEPKSQREEPKSQPLRSSPRLEDL
jgi:hypothetical protein